MRARAQGLVRRAALAALLLVGAVPAAAQRRPDPAAAARTTLGAVVGAAAVGLVGAVAGGAFSSRDCPSGDPDACLGAAFPGFIWGAGAGMTIGAPLGAHLFDGRRGKLAPSLAASAAIFAAEVIVLNQFVDDGRTQHKRAALGVVIAAHGYPEEVRKGDEIDGLDRVGAQPGKLFHAGTTSKDGKVVTAGGRVFCAVGLGATVKAAQREAYALVDTVRFDGAQARRDIGYRAIARES